MASHSHSGQLRRKGRDAVASFLTLSETRENICRPPSCSRTGAVHVLRIPLRQEPP